MSQSALRVVGAAGRAYPQIVLFVHCEGQYFRNDVIKTGCRYILNVYRVVAVPIVIACICGRTARVTDESVVILTASADEESAKRITKNFTQRIRVVEGGS